MALYAKLWTDVLGDPKLMRAARKGAKGLVLLPWLIAFAKQSDDAGALSVNGEPAEPIDIAEQIPGATERQVAQCMAALAELGVLHRDDRGCLAFAKWESRSGQGKPSDDPKAVRDRVHRHRAKKRGGGPESVTPCNALQPALRNTTELEQERELEQEPELEQQQAARRNAPRADSLPAAAAEGVSYAVGLVTAANQGITERWGEQPVPLYAQAVPSVRAAEELEAHGVPLADARNLVYTLARESKQERPPRSLGYWTAAIRERWDAIVARRAVAEAPKPQLVAPVPSGGRATSAEPSFGDTLDAIRAAGREGVA